MVLAYHRKEDTWEQSKNIGDGHELMQHLVTRDQNNEFGHLFWHTSELLYQNHGQKDEDHNTRHEKDGQIGSPAAKMVLQL